MLKKRILASSMASVMALSSVSLVAFADTKDYGEAVTKAELDEYVKSFDKFIEGDLENYGTKQADNFILAIDHAKTVLDDTKAVAKDYTAAYQMIKAVEARLTIKTNDELKALIKDNQAIYDTENILNEEFQDRIYKKDKWEDFEDAFDNAETFVDTDSSRDITDAYLELEEKAAALEYADYVTKSEFRSALAAYEQIELKMKNYETWRRGTISVAPTTGTIGKDKSDNQVKAKPVENKYEITYGELVDMVYGKSTGDYFECWKDGAKIGSLAKQKADDGSDYTATNGFTWIGSADLIKTIGTDKLAESITAQSKALGNAKGVVKTSKEEIVAAYKAALDAVAVFNSWSADRDSTGNSRDCAKLMKEYHLQLSKDYNAADINTISGNTGSTVPAAKVTKSVTFGTTTTVVANVTWDPDKITLTADKDLYVVVSDTTGYIKVASSSGAGNIALSTDFYGTAALAKTAADGATGYTEQTIQAGQNILKWVECPALTSGSHTALESAYAIYANYSKTPTPDYVTSATAMDTLADGKSLVKDENGKYTGDKAEWYIVWRNLKYAFDDTYHTDAPDATVTKKMLQNKIQEAYDLCEKTGDSVVFSAPYADVVAARQVANEFLKVANTTTGYKDGNKLTDAALLASYNAVKGGSATNVTVKDVYDLLKGKVSTLNKWYNDFQYSYDDIRVTISEVATAIDKGTVAGDALTKALEECAYRLLVLEPTKIQSTRAADENVVFDDEGVFQQYNRLKTGMTISNFVKPGNPEKNLLKAYNALIKAYADAQKGTAEGGYDLDNSGGNPDMDDLQFMFDNFVLKQVYDAKLDFNSDKIVDMDDLTLFFNTVILG